VPGSSVVREGVTKLSSVARKGLSERTKIRIWARAAGRCVLCAKYLIDQRVHIHDAELVGQIAHNVGAEDGPKAPRGASSLSASERAQEENLLLLCHECHRSIDDPANWGLFTVDWLRRRKEEHQDRVRRATNFESLHRTLVVTTDGSVRGAHASVSDRQITEALIDSGLVVHVEDGAVGQVTIHLDGDLTAEYAWKQAQATIDKGISKLTDVHASAIRKPDHISVFAIAPIPSLVYLGSRLDDKISIKVFDRRRGEDDRAWCWTADDTDPIRFAVVADHVGGIDVSDVVATINVSGTVSDANLPSALRSCPAIVLAPIGETPRPGILRSEASLNNAADAWMELLGHVEALWPNCQRIHLLAATPVSLAIRIGAHRMRNAQPDLVTYQLTDHGYEAAITITEKIQPEG